MFLFCLLLTFTNTKEEEEEEEEEAATYPSLKVAHFKLHLFRV